MDDDLQFDSVGIVGARTDRRAEPVNQDGARRSVTLDIEFAGEVSIVTVYELGAPRLKKTLTGIGLNRLLDCLPAVLRRA